MDLTKRQQEIFDFIKRYSARHGYPPTVRDIGKAVGLASSSTVHQHLANLERIGLLKRDPSKPRAIELLDRAVHEVRRACDPRACRCSAPSPPVQPMLAEENIEEYVRAGRRRRRGRRLPAARARRVDEERRHHRGDLVVVRPQDTAQDGDIVVALVGEDATVKRYFRESDHVRLQPENDEMEPIRSREVRVLGKVVGLMRSLQR
jgi:repressor LexA